jgi:YVTN family beta-propeller protein
VEYQGERTIDGTTFDVVLLTFDTGTGLTSGDRYWGLVSRDTGLMERWEFVLQQEDGSSGEAPPRAFLWTDWQDTDAGIQLATRKQGIGEGNTLVIGFPVARAWTEISEAALESTLHPTSPLAPPAAPRGKLPGDTGVESLLVVLNKSDHTAALVDPATGEVLRTVPTGVAPHEAAASPDGTRVYVADYGASQAGHTLTVIDPWRGVVLRTVDLAPHTRPHGLAVDDTGAVWITTEGSRSLLRLDPETLAITDVFETGQEVTHMVALSPDGRRAYTTSMGSGTVTFVDRQTGEIRSLTTGNGPEGIAVTPDGAELWVAHRDDDDVAVLDAATGEELARLSTAQFPIRVETTPDGARVLVSSAEGNVLEIFDRATREKVGEIRMGAAPIGIEVAPDGRRAWVANTGADTVTVVDLESATVVDTLEPGREPDGMVWVRRPAPGG